jgi:hypothetical protein
VAYAEKHGHSKTLEHFRISGSMLYNWRAKFAGAPTDKRAKGAEIVHHVLAKKLRRLIVNRIKEENDIGDTEMTALLLVNAILRKE